MFKNIIDQYCKNDIFCAHDVFIAMELFRINSPPHVYHKGPTNRHAIVSFVNDPNNRSIGFCDSTIHNISMEAFSLTMDYFSAIIISHICIFHVFLKLGYNCNQEIHPLSHQETTQHHFEMQSPLLFLYG